MKKFGKKEWIAISVAAVVVAGGSGYGIYAYQADQAQRTSAKKEALEALNLQLQKDKGVMEYSKDVPVDALTLVTATNGEKADDSLVVTANPSTVDPSKIGNTDIVYTVKDKDSFGVEVSKDFNCTITVKDTKNPVITVNQDTYSLTVGDSFDPATVVQSVKDDVDGDITKTDKAPDKNEAGYYTITSDVDTATAGNYKITVDAVDKNGNKASKDVTVTVAEKKVVQAAASNDGGYSYSGNDNSGYNNSGSGNTATYSGGSSSNSSSSNTGGSSEPAPAPKQSICLSADEAEAQYDAWASQNPKLDVGGLTYGDSDGDGCWVYRLNNGSATFGED